MFSYYNGYVRRPGDTMSNNYSNYFTPITGHHNWNVAPKGSNKCCILLVEASKQLFLHIKGNHNGLTK